jgi:hypothetical protein
MGTLAGSVTVSRSSISAPSISILTIWMSGCSASRRSTEVVGTLTLPMFFVVLSSQYVQRSMQLRQLLPLGAMLRSAVGRGAFSQDNRRLQLCFDAIGSHRKVTVFSFLAFWSLITAAWTLVTRGSSLKFSL